MPICNSILPRTGASALLLASLCALSACAFKDGDEKPVIEKEPVKTETVLEAIDREKAKEAANGILNAENTKVEFVENPTPGSYRLVVRWPPTIKNVQIRVNDGSAILKNNVDFAEIPDAIAGNNYKVEVIAYGSISTAPLSMITMSAKAPIDFVENSVRILKRDEIIEGNRLYIMDGARIETRGYQLTVNVNKIYVEKEKEKESKDTEAKPAFWTRAQIKTFPVGAQFENTIQLNGSTIRINAKEAHGELRVALVGVDGAKGADGLPLVSQKDPRPSPPAPESRAGQDGKETFRRGHCSTRMRGSDLCADPGGYECTTLPGNGLKGLDGDQGAPGLKGGRGGNAGTLELNIENHTDFKVRLYQKAGNGGPGGAGGHGKPGTLGGRPGARPGLCQHYPAEPGLPGDAGPQGKSEGKGDDGDGATTRGNGVRIDSEP